MLYRSSEYKKKKKQIFNFKRLKKHTYVCTYVERKILYSQKKILYGIYL